MKIKLNNKKLEEYLLKKGVLINTGRELSIKIDELDKDMETIDKKIQEEEAKVDLTDLKEREQEITKIVEKAIEDMNAIKQEIYERMKKQVEGELHTKYDELKKEKEELETERNKTAIKVQKYNDKIIPLGRKEMKPFLKDEFDDYDTLRIENGEVVATIFNHLEEFKTNFKKNGHTI